MRPPPVFPERWLSVRSVVGGCQNSLRLKCFGARGAQGVRKEGARWRKDRRAYGFRCLRVAKRRSTSWLVILFLLRMSNAEMNHQSFPG